MTIFTSLQLGESDTKPRIIRLKEQFTSSLIDMKINAEKAINRAAYPSLVLNLCFFSRYRRTNCGEKF